MSGLCKKCGKPGEFYPSNPNQCKQCYRDSKARYRSTTKYLVTKRAYDKQWRADNSEHAREQGRKAYGRRKASDRAAVLIVMRRRNSLKQSKHPDVPFTITAADLGELPDTCPVLGIPLYFGDGVVGPNSPTIDRIDPALGYVPGNVMVISHRANTIKHNATIEEIELVLAHMKRLQTEVCRQGV